MLNALDYLSWRGDLTFSGSPVNEVDLFIFSQLATPDYTGIIDREDKKGLTIPEAVGKYFELHPNDEESLGLLQSKFVLPLLKRIRDTARFREVRLCCFEKKFDESSSEQFQAVTLILPTKDIVVSYRGTDDTIIGWKEDCNLAVVERVPAQQDALDYLREVLKMFSFRHYYTVGHSKGGNLSLFAPAMLEKRLQKRLIGGYSFDGPGFSESFLKMPGYEEVKDRLVTILSQYAIIGTLLDPAGKRVVVKSSVKGLYAHDGFYWGVEGTRFLKEARLSDDSLNFERSMKKTLSGLNTEERQRFVDDLFGALLSTGAVTLTELHGKDLLTRLGMIRKIGGTPAIQNFVRMLFENYLKADKQA